MIPDYVNQNPSKDWIFHLKPGDIVYLTLEDKTEIVVNKPIPARFDGTDCAYISLKKDNGDITDWVMPIHYLLPINYCSNKDSFVISKVIK
jgi:hypothetical protein